MNIIEYSNLNRKMFMYEQGVNDALKDSNYYNATLRFAIKVTSHLLLQFACQTENDLLDNFSVSYVTRT